ncbi:isochorismatase family protein [Phenylobacterium sp.]|uniref:isochorismatase family protein n=1 Tax=Phenylobacterium sp. TaxID=1871053 RepID=UPI0035B029DF
MRVPPPAALVCLDLQRGRLADAAGDGAVAACQFVLAQARARRWPVLHVHRREASPETARPILGLEPLASEPVYVRSGPSAFSNQAFAQTAQALGGPLALVGFSLRDTVLATAIAAADRNLPVEILVDAVAADAGDRLAPTYASLAPHCRLIDSDDLLQEEAALVEAANTP